MADLDGRVALVTGGGRGVGPGIVRKLATAGADVAINYRSSAEQAEALAHEMRQLGVRAEAYRADVTNVSDCEAMVERARSHFGHVDILVSNAGASARSEGRAFIAERGLDDFRELMETHAYAPLTLCRLLVPQMRERERGDVVMISSVATHTLRAGGAPYNMAKAAMEAAALTLAKEEVGNNIRVNIVAPGLVETDMGRRAARNLWGVTDLREIDAASPFGFVCQPEDIGSAVTFLVGEGGRYITGQRPVVDGGGFRVGEQV